MQIRIAACQILTYPEVSRSVDKILDWMERAAADGIDAVAFPEAALCGYQCDPEYWAGAREEDFLKGEEAITAASQKLGIAVVVGTAHWEGGKIHNSLLVVDKGGERRGRYTKTHAAERWGNPSTALPVYTLAGVKSCFIICHDIRYPELVRLPAIAGAQVCYYLSNESGMNRERKFSAYRAMPISRATENSIFLVMANAPADLDAMQSVSQSHGNSKIIHPDGNILEEAGHFEERLVTQTIETDDAHRYIALRAVNDATILQDWLRKGVRKVSGDTGPTGQGEIEGTPKVAF
jgi:omega-amidase